MPKPVMSLDEFRDRFLLEIWLFVEGDLAEQFDPHDVAQQVFHKHPRAKESWYPSAVAGLLRDKLISHASDDSMAEQVSDKAFYLTEMGLRWADSNHNRYDGYQDWQLEELAKASAATPSFETKSSRGAMVMGRTPIGQHTLGSARSRIENDTSHTQPNGDGGRATADPLPPEPTYITDEEGNRLLTEDGDYIVADEQPASYVEYEGPKIISTPAEIYLNLDGRRDEWNEFSRQLKALTEEVRKSNSLMNGEYGIEVRRAISELDAGSRLIENDTADKNKLKELLLRPLQWIKNETPTAVYGAVVSELISKLLSLIGS